MPEPMTAVRTQKITILEKNLIVSLLNDGVIVSMKLELQVKFDKPV